MDSRPRIVVAPDFFHWNIGLIECAIDVLDQARPINYCCAFMICLEPADRLHLSLSNGLQKFAVRKLPPDYREPESGLVQVLLWLYWSRCYICVIRDSLNRLLRVRKTNGSRLICLIVCCRALCDNLTNMCALPTLTWSITPQDFRTVMTASSTCNSEDLPWGWHL